MYIIIMLRNYSLTKTDLRLTNNYNIDIGDYVNYKDQVCVKPWGYEFLAYMSKKIGIWILSVKKNTGTSIHTHFKKDTFLIVLNGKLKLEMADEFDIINSGVFCFIPKKKFHGLSALEDNTIFMEIEIYDNNVTFTDKNDLLRLVDKYKRAKTGYESSVNVVTENLEEYNYFYINNNINRSILNTDLIVNTYNNLNLKNSSSKVILLEGQIFSDGHILKEGSLIKINDLKNMKIDNQKFLQIINNNELTNNKIICCEEELIFIKNKIKQENQKIVLTCGCFDILHVGHLDMLKKSKEFGNKLIVCLSSDEQIKHLKGSGRPINNLKDRLKLFSVIPYIDYIYVYYENLENDNETELDKIMNIIEPDVWTKGGDYTKNDIYTKHPGLSHIELIKLNENKSTTNIIKKINNIK
jgi:rfaE bifunctional protein nucleotidyltransferase chain/domain